MQQLVLELLALSVLGDLCSHRAGGCVRVCLSQLYKLLRLLCQLLVPKLPWETERRHPKGCDREPVICASLEKGLVGEKITCSVSW